eukprot:g19987.t1
MKSHLGVTDDADDDLITAKIDAAQAWIESFLGYEIEDEFETPPADLVEAVKQQAAHFFENREAVLGRLMNKDAAAIAALFKSIPEQVKRDIQPAIDQGANEMVARMKHLVPEGDGDLQRSIGTEPGDRPLAVKVVAGGELTTRPVRDGISAVYDYALGQEYGTEEMPAQPFFWPSVNSTKKRVKRRIDRAIRKAIETAWGKK